MKEIPQHKTLMQLSQGDICAAIEYWLNSRILKTPCSVDGITELSTAKGGGFEIVFDRRPIPTEDTAELRDGRANTGE
jgi:hypothetical protein